VRRELRAQGFSEFSRQVAEAHAAGDEVKIEIGDRFAGYVAVVDDDPERS
jgi:N-acetylglucosamine kinase-like BadF-type ATPase